MRHQIFAFLIVILLLTNGCAPSATPVSSATDAPTEELTYTTIPPTDTLPPIDTQIPHVTVIPPTFDVPEKPALNISGLPQPKNYQNNIMKDDVIGFAFSNGNMALMAAPFNESIDVKLNVKEDVKQGLAIGIVWVFDSKKPGSAIDYVLAIDSLETSTGYLIDNDDKVIDKIKITTEQLTELDKSTDKWEIAVSIQADRVCFRVKKTQYCSVGKQLSVKDIYADDYVKLVQNEMQDAMAMLTDFLDGDIVITDQTISEIQQFDRVEKCDPTKAGTCEADILVAAVSPNKNGKGCNLVEFGACPVDSLVSTVSQTGYQTIGILRVRNAWNPPLPTPAPPQAPITLQPGRYVVQSRFVGGQPTTDIRLVNRESGNIIYFVAQLLSNTSMNRRGTVAIQGFRIWCICFWEKCRR